MALFGSDPREDVKKLEIQTGSLNQLLTKIQIDFARFQGRNAALEQSVTAFQGQIAHLPTKTTLAVITTALIAVVGIVVIAYWNGLSARIDAVNIKIDALSRTVDKLWPTTSPTQKNPPTQSH